MLDFQKLFVCTKCMTPNSSNKNTLRKNCPNTEFFWSILSIIWTEHGDVWSKSPYSVQMRENTDQKDSLFGYFSRSDYLIENFGIAVDS